MTSWRSVVLPVANPSRRRVDGVVFVSHEMVGRGRRVFHVVLLSKSTEGIPKQNQTRSAVHVLLCSPRRRVAGTKAHFKKKSGELAPVAHPGSRAGCESGMLAKSSFKVYRGLWGMLANSAVSIPNMSRTNKGEVT